MTPEEYCIETAEYISEHGWCQGEVRDNDGRVCALGAMNDVGVRLRLSGTSHDVVSKAYWSAREKLMAVVGIDIPFWNDAPRRTAEDVILTFKRLGAG